MPFTSCKSTTQVLDGEQILATVDGHAPQSVLAGRCVPHVVERADWVDTYRSSVGSEEATA